jgi:hypothetical protein
MTRTATNLPADRLVYDGLKWCGTIALRLGRWRAVTAAGRVIDSYDTAKEASRAVLLVARGSKEARR